MVKLYSKAAKILSTMPHNQRMDRDQLLAMLKNKGVKPAEIEHAPPLEGRVLLGDAKMHFQSAVPKIYHTELGTDPDEGPTHYEDYSTPGGSDYQEHLLRTSSGMGHPSYKSPHFEGSQRNNLLAHFRTTTRKTADGRKLLHIEEVQSDWGQDGREKGFKKPVPKPDPVKIAELTAQLNAIHAKHTAGGDRDGYMNMMNDPEYERVQDALFEAKNPDPVNAAYKELMASKQAKTEVYNRLTEDGKYPDRAANLWDSSKNHPEYQAAQQRYMDAVKAHEDATKGVAYHPLVRDTSAWTDLALKRILHHAAANGHDGITIAPGKVHGERYGMSKHIDEMIYQPETRAFWVGKEGRNVHDGVYTLEELPGLIGREATEKLLAQPREPYSKVYPEEMVHRLTGNMDFGGDGFKQFYDNQLPKSLAKLAQQHDPSVKVGTYEPENTLIPRRGQPPGPDIRDLPAGQYAHLPITDQMRSSIKENGFPAFARGGDVEDSAETPEGGLPHSRRVRGSTGLLDAPLRGLPTSAAIPRSGQVVQAGPIQHIRDTARKYMSGSGLKYNPPTDYAKVDPARAKRIASAFDSMSDDPNEPLTKASYQQVIKETKAQYEAMKRSGFKAEFWHPDRMKDPYEASPRLAVEDIRHNNHMWVFPTMSGYGGLAEKPGPDDIKRNPMLADSGERWGGQHVTANDLFRAVHDYFGHAKEGVGFRHDGEENAWRSHAAMFSPLARLAMTTETRGQNSWLNFGPHGEKNRKASTEDTVFAPQKVGILPLWAHHEGAEDFMTPGEIRKMREHYVMHKALKK